MGCGIQEEMGCGMGYRMGCGMGWHTGWDTGCDRVRDCSQAGLGRGVRSFKGHRLGRDSRWVRERWVWDIGWERGLGWELG